MATKITTPSPEDAERLIAFEIDKRNRHIKEQADARNLVVQAYNDLSEVYREASSGDRELDIEAVRTIRRMAMDLKERTA